MRCGFCVALYVQNEHWNVFPSCIDWMCILRLDFFVALCVHSGQWNVLPSCIDWMCVFRLPFIVGLYSHKGHWTALTLCMINSKYQIARSWIALIFLPVYFGILYQIEISKMFVCPSLNKTPELIRIWSHGYQLWPRPKKCEQSVWSEMIKKSPCKERLYI